MWLISRTCSRSVKKPNTTSNQPLRRKNDKLSSKRRCLSSLFSCCKLSPVSHLQVDIKLPRNGNMQFNRGSAAVKFYEIDYKDSVVKIQTAVDLSNYLSTMKSLPETIVSRHNKTLFGSDGAITTDGLTDQLVKDYIRCIVEKNLGTIEADTKVKSAFLQSKLTITLVV